MKSRTGFVSNSSSSSFVCVLPKSAHDAILAKMSEQFAEIIKNYVVHGKVGEMEVVGFGDMSGHDFVTYSGNVGWSEDMRVDGDDFDEATEAYEKAIKEGGYSTFSLHFDGG